MSVRAAVAVAATVLGLSAVAVQPAAAAATGYDRCPKGRFCLFSGANGTGSMAAYTGSQATLGSWDNLAASVSNRTGYQKACLWTRSNYQYVDPVHDVRLEMSGTPFDMDLAAYHDANSHLSKNLSSFRLGQTGHQCLNGKEYMPWESPSAGAGVHRPAQSFGDLNRDGHADLLFRSVSGRLWYLRGDGTGTLLASGWNSMSEITRHGDLTGDGREDLIARDPAGALWLYPGKGTGFFGARKKLTAGWGGMRLTTLVGDVTGDGKGDLISADKSGGLWLNPGKGNGTFAGGKKLATGWNAMNAMTGPGDLTGDRKNDLVTRDTSGALWLYPGKGNGTFGKRIQLGKGWQRFNGLLAVGDADGDGKNDLYGRGWTLDLYPGNGAGRLGSPYWTDYDWDAREKAF
ncbi:FG-GAP-like repeat-containing protein [Peterkaempfera sp. SMS 1(5)a]|uniref:FG-GAP-like repeat-containing protein n=1 Tax=Peterkaempfera podocarpi TaxID=3232308 RepID=UPI00366FE8D6